MKELKKIALFGILRCSILGRRINFEIEVEDIDDFYNKLITHKIDFYSKQKSQSTMLKFKIPYKKSLLYKIQRDDVEINK